MKTLITTLVLTSIFTALPVKAGDRCAAIADLCNEVGTVAEITMKARQEGVSLSTILALHEEHYKTASNDMKPMTDRIVQEAYSRPRYSTERVRQEEITEFGNETLLNCRLGMMEDCQ